MRGHARALVVSLNNFRGSGGAGVLEVVEDDAGVTYHAIYTVI